MRLVLVFTVLLLSLSCYAEILLERISVIDQLNVSSRNTTNRLVTQRFTDILPQVPLLFVMDDFKLPGTLSGNISIIQLSFVIIRHRRDTDPDSITVVFAYTNETTHEGPGQVFFTKTIRAPNNPPTWSNASLGLTELITLNVTQGEACSLHPWVLFDFTNTSFLPRNTTLWVGFYVTGTRNFTSSPYAENIVFWCTTSKESGTNDGNPYYFVDEANILAKGFSYWSSALSVEPALRLNSGTHNMAWSLVLLGVAPEGFVELLKSLTRSQIMTIGVSSAVGFILLCLCAICICRQCRRCRLKRYPVPTYELNKRPPLYTANGGGGDGESTEVLLDMSEGGSTASIDLKSSASGIYLSKIAQTPVIRTRATDTAKTK